MQNNIVLITGGNAGIGKATAIELAKMGAEIIITSRNENRGATAVKEIQKKSGSSKISMINCDLSSFDSIRTAATQFKNKYDRLDVLVNNAATFTSDLKKTKEGFEMQFGVNHLGHFLLTSLLIDSLNIALKPRVVNVSSNAHYRGEIDFDNLRGEKGPENYNSWSAYCQSKLANVLFTREFAKRNSGILCNCLHPGVIRTRLGNKDTNWWMSLLWHLFKLVMNSPGKGARTSVYLATAPELQGVSGEYFDDKQRRVPPSETALDDGLSQKLWEVSEKFVAGD